MPKFKATLATSNVALFHQLENNLDAETDIQLALVVPLISE